MNLEEIKRQVAWARQDHDYGITDSARMHWDQESYLSLPEDVSDGPLCYSAGCIAGHTVISHGATVLLWPSLAGPGRVKYLHHEGGIDVIAAEILGLTDQQAEILFAAVNTIDMLERIVKEWEAGNLDYEPEYEPVTYI